MDIIGLSLHECAEDILSKPSRKPPQDARVVMVLCNFNVHFYTAEPTFRKYFNMRSQEALDLLTAWSDLCATKPVSMRSIEGTWLRMDNWRTGFFSDGKWVYREFKPKTIAPVQIDVLKDMLEVLKAKQGEGK